MFEPSSARTCNACWTNRRIGGLAQADPHSRTRTGGLGRGVLRLAGAAGAVAWSRAGARMCEPGISGRTCPGMQMLGDAAFGFEPSAFGIAGRKETSRHGF